MYKVLAFLLILVLLFGLQGMRDFVGCVFFIVAVIVIGGVVLSLFSESDEDKKARLAKEAEEAEKEERRKKAMAQIAKKREAEAIKKSAIFDKKHPIIAWIQHNPTKFSLMITPVVIALIIAFMLLILPS